jgi:hypothetical protein
MIDPQKHAKAFRAIQGILIVARSMARHGGENDRLVDLLDHGEYLPGLVLDPEDQTSVFDEYLGGIARDIPETKWILDEYRK